MSLKAYLCRFIYFMATLNAQNKNIQLTFGFQGNRLSFSKVHHSSLPVIKPNLLVNAKETFKLAEMRIYHEIMAINHAMDPNRMVYNIPYKNLTDSSEQNAMLNAPSHARRIGESLTKKTLYLTKENYFAITGKKDKSAHIGPFPVVEYSRGKMSIELHRHFKRALVMAREYYLAGELNLLRALKSEASNRMYWVIKEAQRKGLRQIDIDLDELKEALGLKGKYKQFKDLKKRVLDVIKAEFDNKWVEFEWKIIRGGPGRGGGVKGIRLNFKPDSELEKELKENLTRDWQKVLYFKYEFPIGKVQNITKSIAHQASIIEGSDYCWSEYYVRKTIWLCEAEFNKELWNKKTPKKENKGGYLYKALLGGIFIDKIIELEKKETIAAQIPLPIVNPPKKKPLAEKDLAEWKDLWAESKRDIAFDKFLELNGYRKEENTWIKYY